MLHWEWIESSYKNYGVKCSEHGKDVAQILGIVWGGLYHLSAKLEDVDWGNEKAILIKCGYTDLSTFDFYRLTDLVILCHDACIRFEIDPHTFNTLKLWFHKRISRDGEIYYRHPTIEQAIERVRKYGGPKLEERSVKTNAE